jgi:hypothetical protein
VETGVALFCNHIAGVIPVESLGATVENYPALFRARALKKFHRRPPLSEIDHHLKGIT